ncbi:LOG family protein [Denitromonas ohlonensis]|uniref:Cytokinin riboside 5'-monophosphate phosphoribohydrolase n=2 Tax=Denitromonas TaxID=139331 RepID=A0A557RRQ1_9RHOO|nr:TIGR00730 family Rossman fold protein [Denitromonas ohlonensis]TVO67850.1 TIGR00730 family Rossman fold protein [Denitromonas ohlonensis]TVO78247.1 TIGR00730 family Rossman fold protein [Denitromonas ohlonensis]
MTFKRLCVFCGARPGKRPEYAAAAQALGRTLAERNIELVYGGGNIGLMGVVADAVMSAGGSAIGVIPEALLKWEVGHQALTRLEVVDSMHTRKARMAELSDGFIALPGGLGTFEELFEVLTWSQLGFHGKPIGLLNVANYYTPLVQMVENGVDEGFMKPENAALLLRDGDIDGLLRQMAEYQAPEITRQIKNEKQL